jgi:ribose transport system substrate-binding protein
MAVIRSVTSATPAPMHSCLRVAILALSFIGATAYAAPYKIGVLLKDKTPGYWTYAAKGAEDAGKALGVELIIKAPPTVMDVNAQRLMLQSLAKENIQALVIGATNPEQMEAPVAELAAKGIKIITLDTPLKDGLASVFVAVDHTAAGDAAARCFAAIIKDGDEVCILRNNGLDRPVLERERKFFEVMKETHSNLILHGDIYASSEKDSEEDRARLLIEKYPNSNAIFASATRGTLAVLKVAREKKLVGKLKVVGFGTYFPAEAAAAMEDGMLVGWMAQLPKDLGSKGVESAVALLSGKEVPAIVRPTSILITQANMHDAAVQSQLQP